MHRQWFLLVPVALSPVLFLTGAWPGPPPPPAQPAFLVRSVPVNHDLVGAHATGPQLLDLAIAQLAPERVIWLHTDLWQRMNDARSEFEAEGTLDLGPGPCVRLDLTVRTPAGSGRCLTISDGHALAEVRRLAGCLPEVTAQLLPLGTGGTPERLEYLADKGCGGPHALLTALRGQMRDITLDTGLLGPSEVIQLRGDLAPEALAAALHTTSPARRVHLYLDAQSLWPQRVEWWGETPGAEPILALEFRRPQVNSALAEEECARLFTYPSVEEPASRGP